MIKEVVTQKIVLVVTENKNQPDKPGLEKSLPYSKVLELNFESHGNEFSVSGKDAEAQADVQIIFDMTGYQLNK